MKIALELFYSLCATINWSLVLITIAGVLVYHLVLAGIFATNRYFCSKNKKQEIS